MGAPHLCVSVVHLIGLDGLAAGLATVVDHHVELRPGPELPLPVGNGGERRDDQEGPLDALHEHLIKECNGLDGLPQTHLIRQDAVTSGREKRSWFGGAVERGAGLWELLGAHLRVVPVEGQPVEAFQLVLPECVAVPVVSGALQFLPVCCERPILHTWSHSCSLHHKHGSKTTS